MVRTKSNISPGIDRKIKKDINKKNLNKLYNELKSQIYRSKKSKQLTMTKSDGGVHYLIIASQIDKVIQNAIFNKLKPLFENIFLNKFYRFRPKKNCHDAFKNNKIQLKKCLLDYRHCFKKYFDKVNHGQLLKVLCVYYY